MRTANDYCNDNQKSFDVHQSAIHPQVVKPKLLIVLWILSAIACLAIANSAQAIELPDRLTQDDFPAQNEKQVKLGQLLFYDKILSGNKNISCATCHHPKHFSADGLSLGIGEGGTGIGPERLAGEGATRIKRRIPRHAPALWNLGAHDVNTLFHDGRLSLSDDYGNGFNSPAAERLPAGLSGLLAAQALLPLASRFEMAGDPEENSVARAAYDRIDHVWPIITQRVQATPGYEIHFVEAFEHVNKAGDISIVDIANALAAFQSVEWQSYDSRFDEYIAGNSDALNQTETEGMQLFYGEASCSECHSGKLFTDQQFHALKLPVFGPGRTRAHDPIPRDTGRLSESDALEDSYRFRTPSLRNVELTSPYGHNGAYHSLEKMIRHHLDPDAANATWTIADATLPDIDWINHTDFIVTQDKREMARYQHYSDVQQRVLSDVQVDSLIAFLQTLTGRGVENTPLGIPATVPSGLPVDQ